MENLFLTQKIKEIENLKADMLESFAQVLRQTAMGAPTNDIAHRLSLVITDAYLLGDLLGIGAGALDILAAQTLKKSNSEGADRLYRHICRAQSTRDKINTGRDT